jgi:hypothetical protein
MFAELAARLDTPFAILDIEVPLPKLRERLARRQAHGGDASEADIDVLERQLVNRDPLAGEELGSRCVVRADVPDIEAALGTLMGQQA